jgi:riboflavin kinase/FMN adenylyltransferase
MPVHVLNWDEPPPPACRGAVLTIGNFDGVHRGHQLLLDRVRATAARLGVPAAALTFEPHPLALLRPETFQPVLTTLAQRVQLLGEHGANHVLVLRTSLQLLDLTADAFFDRILRRGLQLSGLVEGPNFGFGRGREGNTETLARFCAAANMSLEIVEPLVLDGVVVSSSKVRGALQAGSVESAERWLGRPYRITGTVVEGQKRGRTLGFPTANLGDIPMLVPGDGVYAGFATADGAAHAAAINIGANPTFGEHARKVEVHLVGFAGELYGRPIEVDFLARLRDTRPFPSPADLLAQLKQDVEQAKHIFLRRRLQQLFDDEIRPGLQASGSDIQLVDIDRGVAVVKLSGTCGTCASSAMALVMSLERQVKERLPEIAYLEVTT